METTTLDVAAAATRLKEAIDDGRIVDDDLAKVVLERISRVSGINKDVAVGESAPGEPVKASVGWVHTWRWPL